MAEYQHLRELRRQIIDRSNSRFNFFLIVVSATVTSITAMLATNTGPNRLLSALPLAGGLFLLGVMMFTRLVEFRSVQDEYTTALNTIRSFLVQLYPPIGQYFLLPTVEEQISKSKQARTGRRRFTSHGLADSVALINGIVGGFTVGLAIANLHGALAWIPLTAGVAVFAISVLAQLQHARSAQKRSKTRLEVRLTSKGLL
ncbi:hypothetical protein Aglo03_14260 [Actinokineospora globicatena]|uniref:Uncharacterized protein n=1 Tax=Actinokineospora globicatena TaxID=103729 RepID=A0A9W6QL21_9PSEU|nr:hypothetical protein Aglo03_14260 [Actinokineospora globicatena]